MESALAPVLNFITEFFTALLGWMGSLLDFVVEEPLLLIMMILIPVSGVAVGYIARLFSLRA